jgi:archaemetzincin
MEGLLALRKESGMRLLQLLPIGEVDPALLDHLRLRLVEQFRTRCTVADQVAMPDYALHAERQQYHSSEILTRMMPRVGDSWRVLGVTSVDLYIPILTFVFGEAQMGGPCAVVSTHRLHDEFYGLPPNSEMLKKRLLKEAVHELGHTLHLTHCRDYYCVMASSHSVEWIDLKEHQLCSDCQNKVLQRHAAGAL